MNNVLRETDPLRVKSILLVAEVDVLDFDVVLRPATLLPLGICTGLLAGDEGMPELDGRVP